ncbi:uncharacterized protein [Onthophagus taurus]|uniref:uncharacterized protein n=1 Tax=Onthophagus taurus TaxID=166361 RepID=UPI0039BE9927
MSQTIAIILKLLLFSSICNSQQDGDCVLPPQLENGYRFLTNNQEYIPHASVPLATSFKTRCNSGYVLPNGQTDGMSICFDGIWIGNSIDNICQTQQPILSYSKYPQPQEIDPFNLECGVVDDENSSKQSVLLPWDVFLTKNDVTRCLASFISPKHVLTVAHCFFPLDEIDDIDLNSFKILVNPFGNKQFREIEKVSIHENYRGEKQNYTSDIAIATLRDFGNNLQIRPVCFLDDQHGLRKDDVGTIYGILDLPKRNLSNFKSFSANVDDEKNCEEQSSREFFEKFYSPDKFCTTSEVKSISFVL